MGRAKYNWEELLKEYLASEHTNKTEFAKAKGINPSYFRRNTTDWPEKEEQSINKVTSKNKSNVTPRKESNVTKNLKDKKLPHKNVTEKTETRKTTELKSMKQKCGAKAKHSGEPCKLVAGYGTDHLGTGRCKFHGGRSPGASKGNKYARTHGAYESIILDRLTEEEQAVFDAISVDPNMNQEIKILRFKMLRLLDPVEKQIAMGSEFGPEVVTLQVDEVTKAYAIEKLVDGIRKIVKDNKDAIKEEDTVKIIDDVDDVDEMDDAQ